jgi:hypothetical protein
MYKQIRILGLLSIGLIAKQISAQSSAGFQLSSLCDLQTKVAQGEHQTVRVEGVYLAGLEGQVLVEAGCSGRSTHVEFELKSKRNWKRLLRLSSKSNRRQHVLGDGDAVLVVFDGEFYGPLMPDSKFPEAIRRANHPSWDNSGSMTKLVVKTIQSVEALPADHLCAPPKSDPRQWPCFKHDPEPQVTNTK